MFHIANKVYLEYDFRFNHHYSYIVASERWTTHPMLVSNAETQFHALSLDDLLESVYENDVENFWTDLLSKEEKFVVYLDPEAFTRLQIQYWRSIFDSELTVEQLHFLHTTDVESRRLLAYQEVLGQWDQKGEKVTRGELINEVQFKTVDEIAALCADNPASPALQSLDKNKVSFEYLLADYFADDASPYRATLLDKVKIFTWDNWLDELEHLKYEILSGTIDAGKLDPTINPTVGTVESELAKSDILSWTVDPNFIDDVDYIRATYDHAIFNTCYNALADAWGEPHDYIEELNNLINADDYEGLLARDIERGFGSSYTRSRFVNKANQVFATWVYGCVRDGNVGELAPYKLKR